MSQESDKKKGQLTFSFAAHLFDLLNEHDATLKYEQAMLNFYINNVDPNLNSNEFSIKVEFLYSTIN